VLVCRYFVMYQSDGGRKMNIPCFVRFEVFIMKVTVFWDVMWSDRYVPVFQRKPWSLSFILKKYEYLYTALHGIRFQKMVIFIPFVVYISCIFHCKKCVNVQCKRSFHRIFGPESGKVIRRKTLLYSEQCYNLYSHCIKFFYFMT
jgi:hypothetical protein